MKTWTNGKIIEGKKQIDSFNFSLHYSSPVVWEGIRSYRQEDGTTKIWKLKEHAQRLVDSAKILGFEIPYTAREIEQAIEQVVNANGDGDMYIRPIAYAEMDAEGIHSPITKVSLDIYCRPIPLLHKAGDKGIKMVISNIIRSYPQFQMQAKTPTNYQAVQLAKQQIHGSGIQDIFLVDNSGYIVEATVSNFWVFKGDICMTPPNRGSILPGVTRQCLADILRNPSVTFIKYKKAPIVIEKDITKADLYTADCVVLCGTYAEVVNVVEIDGRKIGSDPSHFYFRMLQTEYSNMVRGRKK